MLVETWSSWEIPGLAEMREKGPQFHSGKLKAPWQQSPWKAHSSITTQGPKQMTHLFLCHRHCESKGLPYTHPEAFLQKSIREGRKLKD